jgi:RNA polymerase sigma-70 factor (ECF subfamily)
MHRAIQELADRNVVDSTVSSVPDPNTSVIWRAIEFVRGEFEPRTWEAFWKRRVDGIPAADVAVVLGVSKWAVHQSCSRVHRRLRQELDGLD